MKLVWTIVAAVVLGILIGAGTGTLRAWQPKATGGPKVTADSENFDFGDMDVAKDGSHDFTFTNRGTSPLTLTAGATTCRCTVGEIAEPLVQPGRSTVVRVTWKSKQYVGRFEQTVTIMTNDPDRAKVPLTVTGHYTQKLWSVPDVIGFDRILTTRPTTREVRILSRLPSPPLKIVSHRFVDPATAKFFQADFQPLDVEEAKTFGAAVSGVLVKVTVKPGLPPGRIRQTIHMQTNIPSAPEFDLLLTGTMGRDVTIAGSGWDDDRGTLTIGLVKPGAAVKRMLLIDAHGAEAKDVRLTVVHVEPEFLHVKLGETELLENGKLARTKLMIDIPAKNEAEEYRGGNAGKTGSIVIETAGAQVRQLTIKVRFTVDNKTEQTMNERTVPTGRSAARFLSSAL